MPYAKRIDFALTVVMALICAVGFPQGASAAGGRIAGSISGAYVKQDAEQVPEAPGYVLLMGEFHGSNRSTGPTSYFNDATVVNRDEANLFKGNGPHSGIITLAKDGSAVVAGWHGRVTTVLSKEGQPRTSFRGTWRYINGTGRFMGIKGRGTYAGHFTSKKAYVVDWKGSYTLPTAH